MISSKMLAPAALVAGMTLAVPTWSAGKLYKWTDPEGNITYSQQKPPDAPAETIQLRSSTLNESGAREKLDSLNERASEGDKDREFAETQASAEKARDERLKKNCEIARENMRILQNSSRIQDKDAEGNPYFLDDSAIKAKIDQTKSQIDQNCG